jgi:hypothetical protein
MSSVLNEIVEEEDVEALRLLNKLDNLTSEEFNEE